MNELEEIQSRTCFNQRLDIFFSFGSGAAILLETLNRKRQAVGRRASVVIQGRSQLNQEQRQKERAARRIPQRTIHQSAPLTHPCSWRQRGIRGEKGNPVRLSQQRLYSTTFSPRLVFVNCLVGLLSLLSFFLLSHFRLLFLSSGFQLFGFCCIAKSLLQTCHCHHGSLRSPFPRPGLHLHWRSRSRKSLANARFYLIHLAIAMSNTILSS